MIIDDLKYFQFRQDVKHEQVDEKTYRWDECDVMVTQAAVKAYIESKPYIKKALIAYETESAEGNPTKPHFQGFVAIDYSCVDEKNPYQAVRNHVRDCEFLRTLPLHRGSGYAFTVMNKVTYMSYIKKGGDVRIMHNYTIEEVDAIPEWIQYKVSKEEKKISRREQFSRDFIKYVKTHKKYDPSYISEDLIADCLIDFMGTRTLPEMVPWLKSVIFHTMTVLIVADKTANKNQIRNRLKQQLLGS